MITRRRFIELSATASTGVFLWSRFGSPVLANKPGGTLNLKKISKYQMPLIVPPAMPRASELNVGGAVD